MATCDGDQPRVRPFGAVSELDGRIYIITNNQKKCYQQMMANPKVEISAMGKDGTWIRLECQVVRDERVEAKEQMLKENEMLRSMYFPEDGIMEVLYIKDATATFCSFTGEPETIRF
ncbi:pyridoxamine 5'-phosphate oxidase family protein [Aminipila butyrica]|uniref:pyridoxamine 5'-phosphate oxidase family protein n=1 Tax=Aminipila butyrica TaxID=433296 RepID=UPI001FE85AB7|nr:pyridoxamine 5'-phosphate oxidase family protein [Aminipila butyrica]